jgi:transposase
MILLTQVSLNYKQLNSFLGIAPNEHSSGSSVHGHPTSRHFGPSAIRKLLYLAALSVSTHRKQFRSYFLSRTQEGKPARVVLNNIENKLVKIICAVLRTNSPYHLDYASV